MTCKNLTQEAINQGFIKFLNDSPTAFQATSNLERELIEHGFKRLLEQDAWALTPGGKYYVVRNDSALIAFQLGRLPVVETGMRMIGAHTDSPALKVKPSPEVKCKDYLSIGVEPYGGMLLATWFDRELGLAGRVSCINQKGEQQNILLDIKRPLAVVPSVAIHLDSNANEGRTINKQKELPPLFMQLTKNEEENTLAAFLKKQSSEIKEVLDYDLYFYDLNPARLVGAKEDYIVGGRIDNLLSCYVGLKGFLEGNDQATNVLICNDHEECGSASAVGAAGQFVRTVLQRICGYGESFHRAIAKSMLISADNAHALHPNFPEKHEPNHAPLMNKGPVLKINANQRYATNSETAAYLLYLAGKKELPMQKFVARSDARCGSTIGPLSATVLGVKTLDIGVPTLGMHSIREMVGVKDCNYLYQLLREFFAHQLPV